MRMRAECPCGRVLEVESKVFHHVEDQIAEFYGRHEDCVSVESTRTDVHMINILIELQNANEHLLAIRQNIGRQVA